MVRMQYCAHCGTELGVYDAGGEIDHCREAECAREVGAIYRAEREEARDAAEVDDYERYRR